MNRRLIFVLAGAGVAVALAGAWWSGGDSGAQPPVFRPAPNPYADGLYANGIVESDQPSGANVNVYPEVAGTVRQILVREGERVRAGTPLLRLDDTVQRALSGQQQAQAQAALAQWRQLRAQPRAETLAVAQAQLDLAAANEKTASDQLAKQQRAAAIDARAVSAEALDNAANALAAAQASRAVAGKQYALLRAGAWRFDLDSQQRQYEASQKAAQSAAALLERYTVRAPVDGVVLALRAAVGAYASSQGVYDTYTQGYAPLLVMGGGDQHLGVRCYIDEILISRIPPAGQIAAQMFVRGTNIRVPLEFVRIQPYVGPKIALSDQRQERVDLRVLPVVFRFQRPPALQLYPGQLVDVYVGRK